jgi:multidrug efflux pump subunit AcrB
MALRRSRWKRILGVGLLAFALWSAGLASGVVWLYFQIRPFVARSSEARPTLCISARYDGANAQVIQDTVALPIEAQLAGMEGVESVESICGDDGTLRTLLYMRRGTDMATARVVAVNRVALALPILPDIVKRRDISITRSSPLPNLWLFVTSPDGRWNQTSLRHIARTELVTQLTAIPGVEAATVGWDNEPDLRLAIDPEKLKAHDLTADDIEKVWLTQADELLARGVGIEQFAEKVVGADKQGRIVRLKDVAELVPARPETAEWARWRGQSAVAIAVESQNPVALFASVRDRLPELQQRLKEGMTLRLVPGPFVPGEDGLLIEGRLPIGANIQRIFDAVDRIATEIDHLPNARPESLALAGLTLPCERQAAFRLYIALRPAAERSTTTADIRAQARRILAEFPDIAARLVRPESLMRPPRLRRPVVLSITGQGLEETTRLADAIHERLAASEAVTDVWPDYPRQVSSTLLSVDREKAKALGVRMKDVMDTLRIAGAAAKWPNGPHPPRVQLVPLERADIEAISQLKVRNNQGEMVPLRSLANVHMLAGPEFIQRIDGERRYLITARPAPGRGLKEARRLCLEIGEQVLRTHNLPAGFQIDCTGSDTDDSD